MEARLVSRRDGAKLALVVTLLFAAFLVAVAVDDVTRLHLVPLDANTTAFAVVAIAIVGSAASPWLARRATPERALVVREDGRIRVGRASIAASDVTGLSVAAAERGWSVAIARGARVVFVEVERRADAMRIARALGVDRTWYGTVPLPEAARFLLALQAVLGVVLVLSAVFYFGAATSALLTFGKGLWGMVGVVGAAVSAVLLGARTLLPNQALALARAAWDRHVALHEAAGRYARSDRGGAGDPEREAAARGGPALLARGDEPLATWIARVDALPADGGAYRAPMKKDDLWEALGDGDAPADVRIAAARLLRRKHGEEERALLRIVEDPDVRVRVEAAIDDDDGGVADRLERLGPLFRAR